MNDTDLQDEFAESFYGFEMADEQVGQGPFRPVAMELKHLFESLVKDADEINKGLFLPLDVQRVLAEFLWRPSEVTLAHILVVSPSLRLAVTEIVRRVAPSLLKQIPELV